MEFKVFISSVQREFAKERCAIAKLIRTDRLLRHFFEPYVFEETAATGKRAQKVYLDAVGECDIYLGLIGETYGNADAEGVSPTEREYDKAVGWRSSIRVRSQRARRRKTSIASMIPIRATR